MLPLVPGRGKSGGSDERRLSRKRNSEALEANQQEEKNISIGLDEPRDQIVHNSVLKPPRHDRVSRRGEVKGNSEKDVDGHEQYSLEPGSLAIGGNGVYDENHSYNRN